MQYRFVSYDTRKKTGWLLETQCLSVVGSATWTGDKKTCAILPNGSLLEQDEAKVDGEPANPVHLEN